MSLVDAEVKGKKRGLTCVLAHCSQKQFCEETAINILTRMILPDS